MAYPPIVQKILDLRERIRNVDSDNAAAIIDLATSCIRMSNRITALELSGMHGNFNPGGYRIGPDGYEYLPGIRVAPVTIISGNPEPVPGAALSIVVSNIATGGENGFQSD